MKLNLLPTHVSKSGQAKTAWFVSFLMVVVSIAASVFLISSSKAAAQRAKDKAESLKAPAARAVEISKLADKVMLGQDPYRVPAPLLARNTALANAMLAHSQVYPNLYREVVRYVPDFFRLTQISAQPANPQIAQVTMTGVVHSFQEYADLMIALLRIPGAGSVTRQGYNLNDTYVPNLIEIDQIGVPVRRDQERLPSNPVERLQAMIQDAGAASSQSGFQNLNGFGTDDNQTKGPMPGWSEITVTVLIRDHALQTPNPRETMRRDPGGGTPGNNPGGGGGGGFNSNTPPPPPGGPGPRGL